MEVRGHTVRVSKAPASLASEASVGTRGLPGLRTPTTQGSQCEGLSTQEAAGPSPSMGSFRPQISGKYLCFLPPSQLAQQAAALSCGKRAEAGGSVVRDGFIYALGSDHSFSAGDCGWEHALFLVGGELPSLVC